MTPFLVFILFLHKEINPCIYGQITTTIQVKEKLKPPPSVPLRGKRNARQGYKHALTGSLFACFPQRCCKEAITPGTCEHGVFAHSRASCPLQDATSFNPNDIIEVTYKLIVVLFPQTTQIFSDFLY